MNSRILAPPLFRLTWGMYYCTKIALQGPGGVGGGGGEVVF